MSATDQPGIPSNLPDARLHDMNALLAQNWWTIALRGVIAILFGLMALFVPGAVMLSLALLFATYLLVDGVFGIIAASRAARQNQRWVWLLAEAVLNLIMGAIAAFFPVAAVLAFVLLTAAWALLSGGTMLAAARDGHQVGGRGAHETVLCLVGWGEHRPSGSGAAAEAVSTMPLRHRQNLSSDGPVV
jgi:uncharacterized membrane protein HdeD (DUF308 family)